MKIFNENLARTSINHCIRVVSINTDELGCSSKKVRRRRQRSRIKRHECAAKALPLNTDGWFVSPSGKALERLLVPELICTNVEHSVAMSASISGALKMIRATQSLSCSAQRKTSIYIYRYSIPKHVLTKFYTNTTCSSET